MVHLARTKFIKIAILLIFFSLSVIVALAMWWQSQHYATTENAYVNANIVYIAPRVTGKVEKLQVHNNQYVKQGQVLLELDTEPFLANLNSAQAQIKMHEAELEKASALAQRTVSLVKTKFASQQDGDNVMASYRTAQAGLEMAKATYTQAALNLKYTKIIAPVNGWVTNLSIRPGSIINANQPLFALIGDDEYWIDANFKETEVTHIRVGQPAKIKTDLYPQHEFVGIVDSISTGTGAVFSLLPPQNATGNWVKVTQRIPVKIRVLNPDNKFPLRIGISAHVKIKIIS